MLVPWFASALVLAAGPDAAPAQTEAEQGAPAGPSYGPFGSYFAYGLALAAPAGSAEAGQAALVDRTGAHGLASLEAGWGLERDVRVFVLMEGGGGLFGATAGADVCGTGCRSVSAHLLAGMRFDLRAGATERRIPWWALASGLELVELSATVDGTHPTSEYRGWEVLRLQAGIDYLLDEWWRGGPIVGVSGTTFTVRSPPGEGETHYRGPVHLWFYAGARLTLWP